MTEWMLGTLLILILLIKALEYFELFDGLDFLSAVLRLAGALFFGIASLIVWASRKLFGKSAGDVKAG